MFEVFRRFNTREVAGASDAPQGEPGVNVSQVYVCLNFFRKKEDAAVKMELVEVTASPSLLRCP